MYVKREEKKIGVQKKYGKSGEERAKVHRDDSAVVTATKTFHERKETRDIVERLV